MINEKDKYLYNKVSNHLFDKVSLCRVCVSFLGDWKFSFCFHIWSKFNNLLIKLALLPCSIYGKPVVLIQGRKFSLQDVFPAFLLLDSTKSLRGIINEKGLVFFFFVFLLKKLKKQRDSPAWNLENTGFYPLSPSPWAVCLQIYFEEMHCATF